MPDLKDLSKGRSSSKVEFLLLCDRVGVQRDLFEEWEDADLRVLTLERAENLGISAQQACELVAKVTNTTNITCPDGQTSEQELRTLLLKMLRRDDELRLSDEVQSRYALQPESWDWKWQVTDSVQRHVCEEFGYVNNVEKGLDLLRSSLSLFPNDDEVRQSAHYLRHNIHTDCPIPVGAKVPNILLYTLTGVATFLHDIINSGRATLIIAGSHT